MIHISYRRALVAVAVACATSQGVAAAQTFQDVLVQAPSIGTPQRGSLAGTLSKLTFGPSDLARGSYALPLPIEVPTERGPLLAKVVPTYSPETGISEWGMGWQSELKIQRFQPRGEVDFATDQMSSPWGRLVPANDGSFYPAGLTSIMRVTANNGGWIAQTSDGTSYRFDAADAIVTGHGTFAWMLSRVDTILGDSTTLTWTRNASGRPFLTSVSWGGRGDGTQYQLALAYEPLAKPFATYVSGVKQQLDQRITRVTVSVKQGAGYATRWRYDLLYATSATGPAHYLRQITRTFASGASDPPLIYDYDVNTELWATSQLAHVPGLDDFIAQNGSTAIQPDHATLMDLEQDGMLDVETSFDQTTVHQTTTGYLIEPLPAAPAPIDTLCRPSPSQLNKPRLLARMHGDAVEPQVVVIRKIGLGSTTRLLVCDRLGVPVFDNSVTGNWELSANVRLADIDLDKRPDLVRVRAGEVAVLRNASSGPTALSFEAGAVTALSPSVTPAASWVRDHNGDGRADLMVRHSNGVVVWFGIGGGAFDPAGQSFPFITTSGTSLAGLSTYQFSHGDFNGDGLSDLLLTRSQTVLMFINTGTSFMQTEVPGLTGIPWTVTFPVIADLAGTGNESAIFVNGDQVLALQLTSPSTGLLRSADDGKGTVVRFGYGRAFPVAGLAHRYATLTGLTLESSGYDTVSYSYAYSAPVLHTLGKYLVGFGNIDKHSPVLTERMTFHNDDDVAGMRELSEDSDARTPMIRKFTQRSYDDVQYRGVRWLRPASVETGYRSVDGNVTLSTTTTYASYERELCATVVVVTGPSGELTTMKALSSVAAIPDQLNCLPASQRMVGSHPDPSLDFNYLVELTRNDFGQVTRVTQYGSLVDLMVRQDISYGSDHRIASIGSPGHGTTTTQYDALGRLLHLTDPMGIVTTASAIHPVSDALLAIQTARPDAATTSFFQYDQRERLQALWDDISGGSQAQPLTQYAYQDVTNTAPGRIDTDVLVADTGELRRSVDLIAADGETLVSGRRLGGHVSFGTASITSRNALTRRSSLIGAITLAGLAALTSADLRALGTPIEDVTRAGFGHAIQTVKTYQSSVVGTVTEELSLGGTELVTRVHQPGGIVAESAVDAAGKLVRKTDENGVAHQYTYDALGRLVHIDTPDGGHNLAFDGFGRPSRITREGIGAIAFAYHPVSGLLIRRQHLDASDAVVDATDTSYDALGRQLALNQTGGIAPSSVAFDYDGQLGSTAIGGQLGRLSRVRGDGWQRSELFDPLGRVFEQRTVLDGWRDVTRDKTYRADGSVASETLTIATTNGAPIFSSTKETTLDALGRTSSFGVNSAVLYTLSYDTEGRLARADFTSGDAIVFDYDPVTHQRRGHHVEGPRAGGVTWERNSRGLIAAETYIRGGNTTRREYGYDGRGAVLRAAVGSDVATYTYTASGLPNSVSDLAGPRVVHRTTQSLMVGNQLYTWDASGRVVGKGEWSLSYGANGQLVHASRPGRSIDFVYDEANRRLLKRVDGVPVRAEVAGGVLTDGHFVELVVVGGVVAGVLDNGAFTALLTDPRGTPFASTAGAANLATPYGVRASHAAISEVIDYAQLGRDPDLDVVRMGVRDYDAKLGQFLTPDPLYFEDLDKCLASPVQCSLYGYAGGNPLSFVDPSGLGFLDFLGEQVVPRIVGAVQTLGGFALATAGVALCATGAGCVVGAVIAVYGLSLAAGGANNAINGTYASHPVNAGLASLFGQDFANDVDVAASAASFGHAVSGSPYLQPRAPAAAPPPGVPPDTLVCRGGTCTAENFTGGSGVTTATDGTLSGISTQSRVGASVETLALPFRYGKVGVTTVGEIQAAGGRVVLDGTVRNPNHATVSGITAAQAESLFTPTIPNPVPKPLRGTYPNMSPNH